MVISADCRLGTAKVENDAKGEKERGKKIFS